MTAPTGIRNYSNTAAGATLTASIGATDTSIPLSTVTGDPTVPFTAALSRGTVNEEIVLVTAVIGTTATVTRGYDGTAAKAQSAGATFQEVVVALDFREANNHVNSSGATHGVNSALVGVSDTQTLSNKTLTAPTITNPTVTGTAAFQTVTAGATSVSTLTASGAATLASLSVSGVSTLTGLLTANGGITVPTGQVVTLTDAPAAATAAANKGYVDGLFTSPPTSRKLAAYWGSGTAFPATNIAAGDTYLHTGLGGLMTYNGSAWKQEEIPTVANATARTNISTNYPSLLYVGFQVYQSDIGVGWKWTGSEWAAIDPVYGKMWWNNGFSGSVGTSTLNVAMNASRTVGGFTFNATTPSRLIIPFDAMYRLVSRAYATSGSGYDISFQVLRTRASVADAQVQAVSFTKASTVDYQPSMEDTIPLKAGDYLYMAVQSTFAGANYWGANEAQGVMVSATYAGPLNGATPL